MKNKYAFLFAALLLPAVLMAQGTTKRVLFIGNSYTEVNNLPLLVSQIAQDMGDHIDYESNTPGGCTFSQHCTNQSMTLIRQGGWDVVVLQEQSQYPSFPDSQVASEVFPYAQQLVDSIYANSPCAEPMFYMTWGRKYGDSRNAPYFPVLGTYEGMDSMLYVRYMYMAEQNDAAVCPVGRVWRYIRENYSDIDLYQSDESHPSVAGSYAAACAFYTMIFHRDPTLISFNSSLDPETAATIRQVVRTVVFQDFSPWTRPLPQADFEWHPNGLTVNFANQSTHAADYRWFMGDGAEYDTPNPSHTYANEGSYRVILESSRHCMTDSTSKNINVVLGVGIDEASADIQLYPNPTTGRISVSCSDFVGVQVINPEGRIVVPFSKSQTIDLGQLPAGVYFVVTTTSSKFFSSRIVKK